MVCCAIFEFGLICAIVIDVSQKIFKSYELIPVFVIVTSRKVSYLFSYSKSIMHCINLNIIVVVLTVRARVIDMYSIL